MSETMLQACRLSKTFGRGEGLVRAVDEVDMEVRTGETVAVMGPSGCGKSTLLYLLGGLARHPPSRGRGPSIRTRLNHAGSRCFFRTGRGSCSRARYQSLRVLTIRAVVALSYGSFLRQIGRSHV